VRLASEIERAHDLAKRSHDNEQALNREVERLNSELRRAEVECAELRADVSSRDSQLARMREDATRAAKAGDLEEIQETLQKRAEEIAEFTTELEQARAREQDAADLATRRELELIDAEQERQRLSSLTKKQADDAAGMASELEVKQLEVEQLESAISDLKQQLEAQRELVRDYERGMVEVQNDLEAATSEQQLLRARLRERDQQLAEITTTQTSKSKELEKLREELHDAVAAHGQLESMLEATLAAADAEVDSQEKMGEGGGIAEARREIRRLKEYVENESRRHTEQLREREDGERQRLAEATQRTQLLQLEATVRAQEQEFMLVKLDEAEQRIWMMTDATDRNAARLAAGLAQLEQNEEKLAELRDELEVTRQLLAQEQSRALEQERLLANERAKLARAGVTRNPAAPAAQGAQAQLGAKTKLVPLEDGGPQASQIDPTAAQPSPLASRTKDAPD
jgi:chromosome segregation ATPase